ncbi:hypothetical protein H4R26_002405 [Coemansia thaxteri]|uniref:WKF domain-containing protein n=1 Tax=Coemansia thaxteri TaxID=2663907 RepID=A0A9W8BEM1_9FUNG|nr:hypothetical protein H4R26_002405 [Coemansia thaxteri]KAJ2485126.1 hypothetical protein EV174_001937 [Coemansia sp. RSA 2320]
MAKKERKPEPVEAPSSSESEAASSSESETTDKPAKRKSAAEIRRINKEKQRVAREGSDSTRAAAHQYLRQWSDDRASWKFNKARQLWIIRHLYLESQVPNDVFDLAIQYLDGSGDVLRKSLVSDARLVAEPMSAITAELQTMRSKALGLMPSHVTKAEANAVRRTKSSKEKPTATTAAAAASTAKEGEKTKGAEEPVSVPAEKGEADSATSETAVKRAARVIEVLAADRQSVPVEPPKGAGKKRKQPEPESSADSSDDEDKKKRKNKRSDKKEKIKDKKDKKEKSKDKKEKKEKSKDKKDKKDKK